MEFLYTLLMLVILGLLWLAVRGTEWLIRYSRAKKNVEDKVADKISAQTEKEEADFLRVQESREILENVNIADFPDDAIPKEVKNAVLSLTADELGEVYMRKMFGSVDTEANRKGIAATKSAFAKDPEPVVVAKSRGILPVLSKSERKIYDKVKKS
jgi:hypothetical protein